MNNRLQQKHLKDEIIVLRRININENDLLILAFGKYLGNVTLKAKGSKKITSRFTGQLEPLSHLRAEIYNSGKSLTLTNSQLLTPAPIDSDYANLMLGQNLCKFLLQNIPKEDPNLNLFNLLLLTNHFLKLKYNTQNFTLFFLIKFLDLSGYLGNLKQCHSCQTKFNTNIFLNHDSHLCCQNCLPPQEPSIPLSLQSLKLINFLQLSPDFQNCLKVKIPQNIYQESLKILNQICLKHSHVGLSNI